MKKLQYFLKIWDYEGGVGVGQGGSCMGWVYYMGVDTVGS